MRACVRVCVRAFVRVRASVFLCGHAYVRVSIWCMHAFAYYMWHNGRQADTNVEGRVMVVESEWERQEEQQRSKGAGEERTTRVRNKTYILPNFIDKVGGRNLVSLSRDLTEIQGTEKTNILSTILTTHSTQACRLAPILGKWTRLPR